MNKFLQYLSKLDWAVAFGTLGYGLFRLDALLIFLGAMGLCLAWYRPADRIKAKLERYFLAKRRPKDDSARLQEQEDFYTQALRDSSAEEPLPGADEAANVGSDAPDTHTPKFSSFSGGFSGYASVQLSRNRHNQLTSKALNIARSAPVDWC